MRIKQVIAGMLLICSLVIYSAFQVANDCTEAFLIDPSLYYEWELIRIIDDSNTLSADYIPTNLVEINDILPVNDSRKYFLDEGVAKRLVELLEAFNDSMDMPIDVRVTSGFRTFDYQQRLYESYPTQEISGRIGKPGSSEHQTGLAVDIAQVGTASAYLQETKFYHYLEKHAHEFGFIIRYPKNKQHLTRVMFEPWHLRFVGKDHALKIFQGQLTLEEYWQTIYSRIYTV